MVEQDPVVDLINVIDSTLKKVHTQSLDLSFNELLDMKKEGELKIDPDYQRIFRWSEGSRSRFIESLLLEMPVPPIYVIENEEGKYFLIDGLQRISSYLHLRGELEAEHLEPPVKLGDKLVLTDCDIVKELNGKVFDDLGSALQIRLKRAFVRVEVVRKGSDPRFQYHMFKRLNTGGTLLSEQQIRNCTIRLLNPKFNDFIIKLSKDDNFKLCTQYLSYEQMLDAYDQELVLRFFAFKNNRGAYVHNVGDFLTEYMEAVSDPEQVLAFDYDKEELEFKKTFEVLAKSLGELSFGHANKNKNIVRSFGIYQYEALTMGIQPYLEILTPGDAAQMTTLTTTLENIKKNDDFMAMISGGGKNSRGQLKARIDFVQNKLAETFNNA